MSAVRLTLTETHASLLQHQARVPCHTGRNKQSAVYRSPLTLMFSGMEAPSVSGMTITNSPDRMARQPKVVKGMNTCEAQQHNRLAQQVVDACSAGT